MPDRSRRTRAGRARLLGRRRGSAVAERLGAALRSGRLRAGLTQAALGTEVGVTQGWVSEAEHGLGASGSIETWAALAAGIGLQLAAFFELAPGASPPRDLQHLRRQQIVIDVARRGGWQGRPEFGIQAADGSQRFIDVLLERSTPTAEILVVEVVDLLVDLGEDMRGLERKVVAVRSLFPGRRVAGLLIIRATNRNRSLVREFGSLLASRFTWGPQWLRALGDVAPLPAGDGVLWSASQTGALSAMRLAAPAQTAEASQSAGPTLTAGASRTAGPTRTAAPSRTAGR